MKGFFRSAPFLVFIVALAIRLLYLLQSRQTDPMFSHPMLDSLIHHVWAMSLAAGDWIGTESFFRAPLYPYFLGLIYTVFGVNFIIPRLIQMIIGAFNCVLTLKIGETIFDRKIGRIAGFVAAFYPLFIYFDNELLIPTVLTALILAALYMTLKYTRGRAGKGKWYVTGIVWGLAAITRPNVLLFLVFLPFWLKVKLKEKFLPPVVFGVLGVLTIILPVTVRNYAVSREFVLIAWQGGVNFYIGNNPLSDGKTAIVPGTRKSWIGGFEDARRIAEETAGRKLKNSEVDRFWMNKGLEFTANDPGKALTLLFKKAYMFWGGYEIPNNRDLYFFTRPTLLKFLFFKTGFLQFPFGILLPLAACGVYMARKRKKDISLALLFAGIYFVSFLIFFICARYRVPITPLLIILASHAVVTAVAAVRRRESILYPSLIFIGTVIFFNANLTRIKDNPQLNHLTLGGLEYQKQNYPGAIAHLERAMDVYASDVQALTMLADSYRRTGRPMQAIDIYQKLTRVDPDKPEIYEYIGALYFNLRRYREAENYFIEAAKLNPKPFVSYINLGHIYFLQDSLQKALGYYTKALELRPDQLDALYHAGLTEFRRKNTAAAAAYWKRALAIDPNHAPSRQGLKALSGQQ